MLLALSGKFESGKDTVCALLQKYIVNLKNVSFANNLKKAGALITNTPEDIWFTQEGKNCLLYGFNGMTVGKFQQRFGEQMRLLFHDRIWIDSVLKNYKEDQKIIVTDCRFQNEAAAIKERNGFIIRINRTNYTPSSTRDPNHISEVDLDNYTFDYVINNDSTLEALDKKTYELAEFLKRTYEL